MYPPFLESSATYPGTDQNAMPTATENSALWPAFPCSSATIVSQVACQVELGLGTKRKQVSKYTKNISTFTGLLPELYQTVIGRLSVAPLIQLVQSGFPAPGHSEN